MTDEVQTSTEESTTVDELTILKQRAKLMGIVFSNNIGLESLRAKIADAQEEKPAVVEETAKVNPLEEAPVEKKMTLRETLIAENMRLVRLRIVNLDPKKKDLPGEFFTVANEYLGTVTKFIPYGDATDGGYHVPYCLYKMMRDKKFLSIRTKNDRNNSNQIKIEQRWAAEFSLDVLDPLTPDELRKLAIAQTAAGSSD